MVLPHHSILIDSSPTHFHQTLKQCLTSRESDRVSITSKLEQLWKTQANPHHVLPCLSVRSGLDLYLQAQAYPPGSEVIMTAVNIQDVARVIHHNKLKIIPVDISIDTLGPSQKNLERLVTRRTVAILVAHLFGRWIDMVPVLAVADKYNLHIIEDCAECFCGFSHVGHSRSNISLFSFGVIKFSTSFGGAIAKVKDFEVWTKMKNIESQYPLQTNEIYLKKVLKYLFLYTLLYAWPIPHAGQVMYRVGFDPKEVFIKFIRAFPQDALMKTLRHQPSPALLSAMLHTFTTFDPTAFDTNRKKGEYFFSRLTDDMYRVGTAVNINNHWLFPVLVKNPQECVNCLNAHGVAAYRGSTQLSLIEGDSAISESSQEEDATRTGSPQLENMVYARSTGLSLIKGNTVCTESTQSSSIVRDAEDNVNCKKNKIHLGPNLMEGKRKNPSSTPHCPTYFPHSTSVHPTPEARFLINHVIYLPVNKRVPYRDLDAIAAICSKVMNDKRLSLKQFYDGEDGIGRLDVLPLLQKSKL